MPSQCNSSPCSASASDRGFVGLVGLVNFVREEGLASARRGGGCTQKTVSVLMNTPRCTGRLRQVRMAISRIAPTRLTSRPRVTFSSSMAADHWEGGTWNHAPHAASSRGLRVACSGCMATCGEEGAGVSTCMRRLHAGAHVMRDVISGCMATCKCIAASECRGSVSRLKTSQSWPPRRSPVSAHASGAQGVSRSMSRNAPTRACSPSPLR